MSETLVCPCCGRRPLSDPASADLFYDAMRRADPDQLPSLEGWLRISGSEQRLVVLRWLRLMLSRPPLRGAPAGTEPLVTFLDAIAHDIALWVEEPPEPPYVSDSAEIGASLGGVFS